LILESSVHDYTIRLIHGTDKFVDFYGPGDITKEGTEAVVNAANSSLLGGGGVDGAIHKAGGPSILKECKRIISEIGTLPAGRCVITTAGRLASKYVIHTVGPVYRGGGHGEAESLAACYRGCIQLAEEHGIRSISFPAISTGAYGYSTSQAASIAVTAITSEFLSTTSVRQIRFVLFDLSSLTSFVRAAERFVGSEGLSQYAIQRSSE
jgi:O-acetyl-ADP-ribose deacetylase (regulator of RNase III)